MAVRRESVLLELQDHFSTDMARAAAATALLNKELKSLSGQSVQLSSSSRAMERDIVRVGKSADRTGAQIDSLSGRVSILADLLLTLGPAGIPAAAVAVPAVTALSSALGFTVLAAGGAVIAFGGVGDALEALNKAHLEPTAENLEAAEAALDKLAPAAEKFVKQINSMRGLGGDIRRSGAEALFPGLTEALESLETRGPDAIRIIEAINGELGDIASEGAASLASGRWGDFFHMLETEGPPVLDKTADALGNILHGVSELLEAFAPLNRDGLDWLVDVTEGFDEWAKGLKRTEGFKDFTEYIRENGPQLADTLGAVAEAGVEIVEAAAPLGGPALSAIESFADAVKAIADSEFATPLLAAVSAMRAINRLAPATAGSLALLGGGAAGGAAGGKKGRRGGRGRGLGAGAAVGALIGADILADQLGWEEATDKQLERAEVFAEKWGMTWDEAAEKARVSISHTLDVATGKGLFGLQQNTEQLSNEILLRPVKEQIQLQKDLRAEYGLGFKALENQGLLIDGFTEKFRQQRENAAAVKNDLKYLLDPTYRAKIDLDDKAAKQKQREADDWLMKWSRDSGSAKADLDDGPRRKKSRESDDWITAWGQERAEATVDADAGPALDIFGQVRQQLAGIDGTVATTYVRTVRTVDSAPGFGPTGSADGSFVPKTGKPYADRHLYLLADGEGITTNRNGETDRFRDVVSGINAGLTRSQIKGMLADGGVAGGWPGSFGPKPKPVLSMSETASPWALAFQNYITQWMPLLIKATEKEIKAAEKAVEAAEKNQEVAQTAVDGTKAQMASLAQATTSGFDANLFATVPGSSNIWAAGARGPSSDPFAALATQRAGLAERQRLQAALAGAGLDGEALNAALSQARGAEGNAQLAALLQTGRVQEFEDQFNQVQALRSLTGTEAGQFAFGGQLATQSAHLADMVAETREAKTERREQTKLLRQLERRLEKAERIAERQAEETGQKVGEVINGAAAAGHRDKKKRGK